MCGGTETRKRVVYVFLIIFIVVCVYQLHKVLDDFINGSKWTNSVSPVSVHAVEFPIITICNYNRVNRSQLPVVGITEEIMWLYVDSLNLYELVNETLIALPEMSLVDNLLAVVFESFWNVYQMMPSMVGRQPNIKTMALGRALYNAYLADHPKVIDQVGLLHTLSFTCNAAYSCGFNGMVFDCCSGSYQVFTLYGSCFTIVPPSMDGIPKQSAPGSSDGLQLAICAQMDNAISTVVNNRFEVGFHLFVGYDDGASTAAEVPLPIGFRSQVEIKKTSETTTEKGIGLFAKTCVDHKETSLLHLPYTVEDCIAECYIVSIIEKCNCVPAESNPRNGLYKSCQPDDLFLCVNPNIKVARRKTMSNETFSKFTTCRENCRKPCSRHSIELTSSLAVTPSKPIIKKYVPMIQRLTGWNMSESSALQETVMIDVYFKDLSYIEIINFPRITIEQLLGNVGGVLGLWIGASLFTIVELIESCCSAYSEKRKTKPAKKAADNSPGSDMTHPTGDVLYSAEPK